MQVLENLNVVAQELLVTPETLKRALPVPETVYEVVGRHSLSKIAKHFYGDANST